MTLSLLINSHPKIIHKVHGIDNESKLKNSWV